MTVLQYPTAGILAVLLAGSTVFADDHASPRRGSSSAAPLAELPSKPSSHVEAIKALGDRQWLALPETAADPNCPSWGGKSYTRSWTQRACYASELGGAFVIGEANHGAIDKKSGYYGDDFWFYDANANRWIALYPGTHVGSFADKLKDGTFTVDALGVVRDKKGVAQPIVPLGGHGGWTTVYDKANREFAWFGTTVNTTQFGPAAIQEPYKAALKDPRRPGIWTYSIANGTTHFEPLAAAPTRYDASAIYVDSKKQVLRVGAAKQWWYDIASRTLRSGAIQGEAPPPANTYGTCYDSKRDRIYAFGSRNFNEQDPVPVTEHFWQYDVKTDRWHKPNPEQAPHIQIENGRFMMDYDSVNDKVVIFYVIHNIRDPKGRAIHVYDPASNAFEKPIPVTEKELPTGLGHGFFNAELNAFFVHIGSGDNRQADPYVWRYRRASEGKAKLR